MCFRWLKRIYHFLRRKCSRRSRGYSRDISLSHGGFCSGSFSGRHGRGSWSCGREGSVTFTRRPSPCPPPPASFSISGGFSCDAHGSLVVPSRERGVTSGWDVTVGTTPVYGPGAGMGYGGEDVGSGAGSVYHPGDLGSAEGAGYGYAAPLSDPLTSEGSGYYREGLGYGSGYYGAGLGYGVGALPGPELGPACTGCAQVEQQKCPVVVPPPVQSQQCKQSPQWPPVQKK